MPENKLEDYGYYLALRVGLAANISNSAKNFFTFLIMPFYPSPGWTDNMLIYIMQIQ